MQDRYAGDIGDFGKYGLLRALCGADEHGPALKLGVLWYRVPNEEGKNDGRIIGYLNPPDDRLRQCDVPLFDSLRHLVKTDQRSVAQVQIGGILPAGTKFFERDVPRGSRDRQRWLHAGHRMVEGADLVFVDPDNGLRSRGVDSSRTSVKHTYYDELRPLWDRNQSVVVYQHATRHKGGFTKLIADLRVNLREQTGGAPDPIVLRWRRRQARAYFILAAPQHHEVIAARCSDLLQSAWGTRHRGYAHPHFALVEDS